MTATPVPCSPIRMPPTGGGEGCVRLAEDVGPTPACGSPSNNNSNPDEVKRWSRSPMQPKRWQLRRPNGATTTSSSCEVEDEAEDADIGKEEAGHAGAALPPLAPEITSRGTEEAPCPSNAAPTRELFDLIVAKSWHRAARLCQAHPKLATYRGGAAEAEGGDDEGSTCLFVACQHRPPVRVVQALLSAYPEATRIECQLVDPTIPDANNDEDANKDVSGSGLDNKWLPLHMACRYNASLSVLQALLEHDPEASLAGTSSSSYPINELYNYRDTFESSFAPSNYRSVFWQKVGAVLRAMAACQNSTLVHVAALSGIPDVLDYALSDCAAAAASAPPESSHPLNALGQTPLHVALIHAAAAAAPAPTTAAAAAASSSSSQSSHATLSSNVLTIVTKLLAHDASLTNQPDPQHRYPLHMALSLHSHPHVHSVALKILQAEPASVTVPDPVSHLFPFQMAASLTTVAADVVDVEVVYRILRTHPSALGRCRRTENPQRSDNESSWSSHSNTDSRLDETVLPAEPLYVKSEQDGVKAPAEVVLEAAKLEVHEVPDKAQETNMERTDDNTKRLAEPPQSQLLPEETTETASRLVPRSCPSSPAKSPQASLSLSSHQASAAAKSISLTDFFQSPRTKKKQTLFSSRESSTVAMALDVEALSADDTCLLSGTVDLEDDDDRDNVTNDESVDIPVENDPIVRSINGMCSGALLLLTTMFHQSATDLLSSSSHHSKRKH